MLHPSLLATLLVVSACATDVTADDAPDFDLDGAATTAPPDDGKADGATQVVFLNFGGARLTSGDCSDAPSNCSSLVAGTQDLQPFTVSDQWDRPKVVAAVASCVGQFFDDMNVRVVTSRPSGGSYTMIMIGAIYGSQLGFTDGAGPYGRAPVDCGNSNKNDIGFILLEGDTNPDFYFMCRSIAHEIGHTFGMLHTHGETAVHNGRVDMMCEHGNCFDALGAGARWDTVNRDMLVEGGQACDGRSTQNTYARLMETLGVRR